MQALMHTSVLLTVCAQVMFTSLDSGTDKRNPELPKPDIEDSTGQ